MRGSWRWAEGVFLEESGAPLIRRHAATGDPLFTEGGYAAYADDLLARMVNPWLFDRVDRIIRDPARKLGWDDRLFGTMRLSLEAGIPPVGHGPGRGGCHGIRPVCRSTARESPRTYLGRLWGTKAAGPVREACLSLVEKALPLAGGVAEVMRKDQDRLHARPRDGRRRRCFRASSKQG